MLDNLDFLCELEVLDEKIPFYTDENKIKLFAVISKRLPFLVVKPILQKVIQERFPGVRLDETILKDMLASPSMKPRRLGLAKPPTDPTDEKLILLAKPFSFSSSLRFLDNIEPGREVARIIPPKEGEDGYDIFGNIIKCRSPKTVSVIIGENLNVDEQEKHKSLVSKAFGYLHYDGAQIDVKEELVINGDVSQTTGNIRFNNKVKILGNVGVGFIVKADRGIVVNGDVYKHAELFCGKGSIIIKGNVDQAKLNAEEEIEFFSGIRCQVVAKSVLIKKDSLQCDINSREKLECKNMIGGLCSCSNLIKIDVAGNEAGIETILEIVVDAGVASELKQLNQKIETLSKVENIIRMQLGPYEFKKPSDLPKQLQDKINQLREKLEQVQHAKSTLVVTVKQLSKQNQTVKGEIQILKIAYPGVIFKFGDEKMTLTEQKRGPFTVRLHDDTIRAE